jgi:UDP-N-acetylmuramate: L-alanyl-gamma-D-glutamyl-meso-diaminopimelate ligase
VHYRPRTAILNNLEHDHADIFPDLAAIETQFHHLVRTVPSSGRLVVNARDDALQRVLQRGCWSEVQRFGARREEPGVLRARGEPHAFDVLRGAMRIGASTGRCWANTTSSTRWPPSPRPNMWAWRPTQAAAPGQLHQRATPPGTAWRSRGVRVYDDFAHHPTAMRATLEGLRRKLDQPPAASPSRASWRSSSRAPTP